MDDETTTNKKISKLEKNVHDEPTNVQTSFFTSHLLDKATNSNTRTNVRFGKYVWKRNFTFAFRRLKKS